MNFILDTLSKFNFAYKLYEDKMYYKNEKFRK